MLEKYEILEQTVSILPRELGVSTMGNVSSVSEDCAMNRDGSVAAGSATAARKNERGLQKPRVSNDSTERFV
jgi:hypothetical protein